MRYAPQYLPLDASWSAWPRSATAPPNTRARTGASDAERKDLLLRTGIAAFLSMNVMMFSLVVYASYFEKHHRRLRRATFRSC